MGSSALFQSGKVFATPSSAPVYTATHRPSATPAISSAFGSAFFRMSSSAIAKATSVNPARKTTPQLMTDPKLDSRRANRSGLCRPASASSMSSSRPAMTTAGAIRCPARRMLTASGCFHRRYADATNAPPPIPARNKYHAMMPPHTGS